MPFGEIALNWAIRSPKERALTRHSRAFGRRRGNIGWNWPGREPCDSQAIGKPTSRSAMLPKPPFRLETVPLEFQTTFRCESLRGECARWSFSHCYGFRRRIYTFQPAANQVGQGIYLSRGRCCLMVACRCHWAVHQSRDDASAALACQQLPP